jgi:hypothetical protein
VKAQIESVYSMSQLVVFNCTISAPFADFNFETWILECEILTLKEGYGGGWTRTNGDRSRGIYSPLQLPLCDAPQGQENFAGSRT